MVAGMSINDMATKYGFSRQSICAWLKTYKLKREVYVEFTCDTCKGQGRCRRKVYDRSKKHFCCKSCHIDYLRSEQCQKEKAAQRKGEDLTYVDSVI